MKEECNVIFFHEESKDYIYPMSRNKVLIKLFADFDFEAYSLYLVYWNRFKGEEKKIELEDFSFGKSPYKFATIEDEEPIKYLRYYFCLEGEEFCLYYSVGGESKEVPKRFFEFSGVGSIDIMEVPSWVGKNSGYQIFPERFNCSGDKGLFVPWNSEPKRDNFFGGNIKGIIEKIYYLKDLGIDVLYLNPIFESPSNHKYDTIDYFEIDKNFGNKEDFKDLVDLCHKENIKIILDGVFHHIGYYSKQFQDVIEKGKSSPYWDWFYIDGDCVDTKDINYECVGYYKWMPKINFSSESARKYFLEVGRYWVKNFDIDGWRLDVADEVDYIFWQDFRRAVKEEKDVILIAETWKNGKDMLRGDQMDSLMNYRFRDLVLDYMLDCIISTEDFCRGIEKIYFDYNVKSHKALYNLLGSHDTERFLTRTGGNLETTKAAIILQYIIPGIPFLYYGDEIAMTGDNDPLCRATMKWEREGHEFTDFYKEIIKLRKRLDCLETREDKVISFEHMVIKDNIYVFIRKSINDCVIYIYNSQNYEQELNLRDLLVFTGIDMDLKDNIVFGLKAKAAKLLLKEKDDFSFEF